MNAIYIDRDPKSRLHHNIKHTFYTIEIPVAPIEAIEKSCCRRTKARVDKIPPEEKKLC